jgi:monofunctional biosynthetic peptidoglycan transglycosylase
MGFLLLLLVRVLLTFSAIVTLLVAVFAVVPPPTTSVMIQSSLVRGARVEYDWTSDISPQLFLALVAAEDQRFDRHDGFDLEAIEKAARHNSRGGSLRGASTISQQVAKNLFLWPERSWLRKGLEAGITVILETIWPKRRILEVYANIVEMGPGVFGASAAAKRFFGKTAGELTAPEAALLAATLPSPSRFRPDKPSPYLRRRQQWILTQMTALGGTAWLRRLQN